MLRSLLANSRTHPSKTDRGDDATKSPLASVMINEGTIPATGMGTDAAPSSSTETAIFFNTTSGARRLRLPAPPLRALLPTLLLLTHRRHRRAACHLTYPTQLLRALTTLLSALTNARLQVPAQSAICCIRSDRIRPIPILRAEPACLRPRFSSHRAAPLSLSDGGWMDGAFADPTHLIDPLQHIPHHRH